MNAVFTEFSDQEEIADANPLSVILRADFDYGNNRLNIEFADGIMIGIPGCSLNASSVNDAADLRVSDDGSHLCWENCDTKITVSDLLRTFVTRPVPLMN